jgi:hypothetical protein
MRREMSNKPKKESAMIMQLVLTTEMDRLNKRREVLRRKLQKHFSLPIQERNYGSFEKVVDELDDLRRKIREIREGEPLRGHDA